MYLLEKILKKIFLNESVSVNDVTQSIDNHNRVIINYHSKGEDKNTGARVIEVYAYGLTKAGNPVIRAFQPYGDTTSRVPSWKFFRLDRITAWKQTKQQFNRPADFYYKGLGDFNPNGDETMSVVYKIAKFGDEMNIPNSGPKTKAEEKPEIYRTDTENRIERMRQQMNNPINISDIKTKDAFKDLTKEEPLKQGPKTKAEEKPELYRTDTERNMEKLLQQVRNPKKIDLSKFDTKTKSEDLKEPEKSEIENIEQQLDTEKPITLGDLNKKLKKKEEPETYKTDTEKNMERLRQQLNNPRKIDLSKIPKR